MRTKIAVNTVIKTCNSATKNEQTRLRIPPKRQNQYLDAVQVLT